MSVNLLELSLSELERLQANAIQLAQSGNEAQRAMAENLLPMLGAILESRRQADASFERERKKLERRANAVSVGARRRSFNKN